MFGFDGYAKKRSGELYLSSSMLKVHFRFGSFSVKLFIECSWIGELNEEEEEEDDESLSKGDSANRSWWSSRRFLFTPLRLGLSAEAISVISVHVFSK